MSEPAGTQPARTALAWQRTGLSFLLVAAVLLRGAAAEEELLLVVPAAAVAIAGLLVLGVLTRRRQQHAEDAARTDGDARAPRTAALTTGLVVLAAVCGLAAELVLRP